MIRTDSFALVLSFLGGVVLLLIIAPLAGMFLSTPLADVFETARETEVQSSIWLTLLSSLGATLFFCHFCHSVGLCAGAKKLPRKTDHYRNY